VTICDEELLALPDGGTLRPDLQSAQLAAGIYNGLGSIVKEYGSHEESSMTEHEKVEESYLAKIVGPLRAFLQDYQLSISQKRLTSSLAKQYAVRLKTISHQILLLRKADAAYAQQALDVAKRARKQTLRDSLAISIILLVALIFWAAYFLINLSKQTQLEIYQEKMMTAALLAQSLAHEIRNPLGIIKSAADILAKRQNLDQESRELAGYMVDEVMRIDSLIKELLSLSRKKNEIRENVDIGQLIRSVLDFTSPKIKEAGVAVHFIQKSEGAVCHCVPGQIRQIVLNLLLNALDVSPKEGNIDITTEKKDNSFIMTFRDYGKGFPPQDKERIFELFYTTKESGFGIGLAVVKRIIEEHQGHISVQSSLGQGSLFTVTLPLRP
jgi:signal transduction histidine kinase